MNKKVPEIRFDRFVDNWEQRELKEVSTINPKSMLPEEFEYVDLESVVGTSMVAHRKETKESAPSRAQRLAMKGDIFYQTVRPYQKNNYLFNLSYDYYVFSTGYAQIRSQNDSYFLFSRLQEERFVLKVLDRCTGTSYPAINSNDLAQIEIGVPLQNKEQSKIGSFFKIIDTTVALHQHELENLKKSKKAFLQKMFPKDGETVPEIRFPGFSDEWSTNKLKDMIKSSSTKEFIAEAHIDGEYPVIQQGDKPITGYSNKPAFHNYKNVTLFGDHTLSFFKPTFPFLIATDGVKILSADNLYGYFFYTLLQKYKPKSQGYKRHLSVLKNIHVYYPKNGQEQIKIGNFFKKLDDSIALRQSKLDQLEKLKKAFLQKMFV